MLRDKAKGQSRFAQAGEWSRLSACATTFSYSHRQRGAPQPGVSRPLGTGACYNYQIESRENGRRIQWHGPQMVRVRYFEGVGWWCMRKLVGEGVKAKN